jgi:hypothetical protein
LKAEGDGQGDQIGRILLFTLGRFYQNYGNSPQLGRHFPKYRLYILILTKKGWDTFWAIFFTNSSSHPGDSLYFLFFQINGHTVVGFSEQAPVCIKNFIPEFENSHPAKKFHNVA